MAGMEGAFCRPNFLRPDHAVLRRPKSNDFRVSSQDDVPPAEHPSSTIRLRECSTGPSLHLDLRVQALELRAGIVDRELPFDTDRGGVGPLGPCAGLATERLDFGDVTVEACLVKTLNSISAMSSQLPCLGV